MSKSVGKPSSSKRIVLKITFTTNGVGVSTFGKKQLPMISGKTMNDNPEFKAFNLALHKFRKQMMKAGELG